MKLLVEVLAGVAAFGIAYYVALPRTPGYEPVLDRDSSTTADRDRARVVGRASQDGSRTSIAAPQTITTARTDGQIGTQRAAEQQHLMNTLRNEVIRRASEDMRRRSNDVLQCLEGIKFAGPEKLRFSVEVVSTRSEASTGSWRFVEVADGEPTPTSFAMCAGRVLSTGMRLVPALGAEFPEFRGEMQIVYTLPAPTAD